MDPRISNAIVTTTKHIFKTMVFLDIQDGQAYEMKEKPTNYDFSGIVGLSGTASGAVGVHFNRAGAAKVGTSMLGSPIAESSNEVKETVGELANMIAGGLRNELSKEGIEFDISIPTVVAGDHHSTDMLGDAVSVAVPFQMSGNEFVVQACIKMK